MTFDASAIAGFKAGFAAGVALASVVWAGILWLVIKDFIKLLK